jgi:hypothetical protein
VVRNLWTQQSGLAEVTGDCGCCLPSANYPFPWNIPPGMGQTTRETSLQLQPETDFHASYSDCVTINVKSDCQYTDRLRILQDLPVLKLSQRCNRGIGFSGKGCCVDGKWFSTFRRNAANHIPSEAPSHPRRLESIFHYLFVTENSSVVKLFDEAHSKCSVIYYSSVSAEYMKLDS